MNPEEKIIIQELRNKNRNVFEYLFKEYYAPLTRFAEGILFDPFLSEDVVQNLFLYVWDHSEQIEINSSIKAYLYQSVKNRCLNRLKSIHVQDKNNWLFTEGILNSQDTNFEIEHKADMNVQRALKELSEQQREIIQLKYFENQRLIEIAKVLDVSINTVKTQLLRAKDKLRKTIFKPLIILVIATFL